MTVRLSVPARQDSGALYCLEAFQFVYYTTERDCHALQYRKKKITHGRTAHKEIRQLILNKSAIQWFYVNTATVDE